MKYLSYICVFVSALMLSGCLGGDSKDDEVNYLAVQLGGSQRWSIVDARDGKVIADGEFKESPSTITPDGYFYASDSKGRFYFYNVSDVSRQLNEEPFVQVTLFNGGKVTAVVKEGEPITLIDKSMNVVATLDKSIRYCGIFHDGLAMVVDEEQKYGFVNERGDFVVRPKYNSVSSFSDGVAFGLEVKEGDENESIVHAIDTKGEELYKFSIHKYDECSFTYENGYMAAVSNEHLIYLDKKGEKLMSFGPFSSGCNINNCRYDGKYFIFCNDEGLYGLKDKEGEKVLPAKYEDLSGIGGGKYIASRDDTWGLIDAKGETLLRFDYDLLLPMRDNVLLAKSGKRYTLIDYKGKEIGKEDFGDYSFESYSGVYSNYLDINELIDNMLNSVGSGKCCGFQSGDTAADLSYYLGSPSDHRYSSSADIEKDGKSLHVSFSGYIAYDAGDAFTYDWQFSRYSYIESITQNFDLNGCSNLSSKIEKAFAKAMSQKGFSEDGENEFVNASGDRVTLSFGYDTATMTYYFAQAAMEEAAAE